MTLAASPPEKSDIAAGTVSGDLVGGQVDVDAGPVHEDTGGGQIVMCPGRAVAKALMGSPIVVEVEVAEEPMVGLGSAVVVVQKDLAKL